MSADYFKLHDSDDITKTAFSFDFAETSQQKPIVNLTDLSLFTKLADFIKG